MVRRARGTLYLWPVLAVTLALTAGASPDPGAKASPSDAWTEAELATLRSLWIGSLPPAPDDPSNAYDTDPRAARLGRAIFFDTRFSANGAVSCGTCHVPQLAFQDARPRGRGIMDVPRRTMTLVDAAYATWFFWDGRKDSLWSQALGPPESPAEHGISRTRITMLVRDHYREPYQALFGPVPRLPTPVDERARPADDDAQARRAWDAISATTREAITHLYVNVGKAIAAFERTIRPAPAPFDRYVESLLRGDRDAPAGKLPPAAVRGLRLFIGKARCTNCHSGPLLTNGEFHATLVPPGERGAPDAGRADGLAQVVADEFNCRSRWSDAKPEECTALRFISRDTHAARGAFKTPSLRNVAERAPYMHAGQFKTLGEVLRFYRDVSRRVRDVQHGGLTDAELTDLQAFLATLSGPVEALEETTTRAAPATRASATHP